MFYCLITAAVWCAGQCLTTSSLGGGGVGRGRDGLFVTVADSRLWLISGYRHDFLEYRGGKKCSQQLSVAGTRWIVDAYFHVPHPAFVSGVFRPPRSSLLLSSLGRSSRLSFLFCIKAYRQSHETQLPKGSNMLQPIEAPPGSPRSDPPPHLSHAFPVAAKKSGENHVSVH